LGGVALENGRAVEHWDNLQPKPAAANRSGHTMIDGDTTTADLGKTTENKRLVENFEHDILIDGSRKRLPLYFDRNRLIQHDPLMRDNVTGFTDTLDKWAKDGTPMTYTNIHKVLGDGNFVLSLSEGMPLGKHVAFFDLFRIEKENSLSIGMLCRIFRSAQCGKMTMANSKLPTLRTVPSTDHRNAVPWSGMKRGYRYGSLARKWFWFYWALVPRVQSRRRGLIRITHLE
jgi:predicted SnoaL-like aldol condensation-catalyzing enzyme